MAGDIFIVNIECCLAFLGRVSMGYAKKVDEAYTSN